MSGLSSLPQADRARLHVLMALAGPAAQQRWPEPLYLQVARHESAHAVIGRALGFHIGQTSALAQDDTLGHCVVDEHERLAAMVPAAGSLVTVETDRRYALRYLAASGVAGWRALRRRYRELFDEAAGLVRTHRDAIDHFAHELLRRGTLNAAEVNAALAQIDQEIQEEQAC